MTGRRLRLQVADILVDAGITAILNFAPVRLSTEPGVKLKNMDLAISFESLSYFITKPALTQADASKFVPDSADEILSD